jgi:putative membrane protein
MPSLVPIEPAPVIASASAIAGTQPRHLHPLSLVLAMLRVGPQSLNLLPAIAVIGATGRWALIVPAILLFLAIALIIAWLKWVRFTWRVDEDGIAIDSGIISRNSRDIPFDRIQDVAIEQGLMARMVGIATVSFDTGSAEADDKEEGKLAGIAMAEAEALRDYIRSRRADSDGAEAALLHDHPGTTVAERSGVAKADAVVLFAMTPSRLLLAGLFNFSLAVFVILFGLLNSFDQFLPFDPFEMEVWAELARSVGLEQWVIGHSWLAALGGTVSVLVLGLVTGVVRTLMKEWNFKLERTARGLRRTRGLTTRTDVTLPRARVQAAIIDSGIIRRRFGWFALKLQSLASDGKDDADYVIAPFARLYEIDQLLEELALDRADLGEAMNSSNWQPSHPIGVALAPVTLMIAALLAALPISAMRPDLLFFCGLAGLLALLSVLPAWLAWRLRRWHFDGRLLHVTSGLFRPRHVILPASNIQSLELIIGPIARHFGLAELRFGVAGGGSEHAIADIPVAIAIALRDQLLAEGARQ